MCNNIIIPTYGDMLIALRARQRRDRNRASQLARTLGTRAAAGYLRNQGYTLTAALAWLREHSEARAVQ